MSKRAKLPSFRPAISIANLFGANPVPAPQSVAAVAAIAAAPPAPQPAPVSPAAAPVLADAPPTASLAAPVTAESNAPGSSADAKPAERSKKRKRDVYKFQPRWLEWFPWLRYDKDERACYCNACQWAKVATGQSRGTFVTMGFVNFHRAVSPEYRKWREAHDRQSQPSQATQPEPPAEDSDEEYVREPVPEPSPTAPAAAASSAAKTAKHTHNYGISDHDSSATHMEAMKKWNARKQSDGSASVAQQLGCQAADTRAYNRRCLGKIIRSIYWLARHKLPHSDNARDLCELVAELGAADLQDFLDENAGFCDYLSHGSVRDWLHWISDAIREPLEASLRASPVFSVMADESMDISSEEQLSIYGRWLVDGTVHEHFLGMGPVVPANARQISDKVLHVLQGIGVDLKRMRGLGFDGASVMSGNRSGAAVRLRCHCTHALYVHCKCHCLNLASLDATKVKSNKGSVAIAKVYTQLFNFWCFFHDHPARAQALARIQGILNDPELKSIKPSDTRWLSYDRAVGVVISTMPSLMTCFENLFAEGDDLANAHRKAMLSHDFVAGTHLLAIVLHILAKTSASLSSSTIDFGQYGSLYRQARDELTAVRDTPDTVRWYPGWPAVFNDTLKPWHAPFTKAADFNDYHQRVAVPYITLLLDCLAKRFQDSPIIEAFQIFDPRNLPADPASVEYGEQHMKVLSDWYARTQTVDTLTNEKDDNGETVRLQGTNPAIFPAADAAQEMKYSWRSFRTFLHRELSGKTMGDVLARMQCSAMSDQFPGMVHLLQTGMTLPVVTASNERSFSVMKLIKSRLRSSMGDDTLEFCMRIAIEGPERLPDAMIAVVLEKFKQAAPVRGRRIIV